MRKSFGRYERLVLVAVLLLAACSWLIPVWHFNLLTGTYSYDPRHEQPGLLIAADRPDQRLLEVLNQQIARDGTYPLDASVPTAGFELTQVKMELYTDWSPSTTVTAILRYADGSSRTMDFLRQCRGCGI